MEAPAGTLLAAAAAAGATAAADEAAAGAAAPPPKPQPVFPACVEAPGPEQMPVGLAQHPLPQSASLRHWPPMNWAPCPLPTFLAPAGSKGGTAHTVRATLMIVSEREDLRWGGTLTAKDCEEAGSLHDCSNETSKSSRE